MAVNQRVRILAVGDIIAGDSAPRFGFGAGTTLNRSGSVALTQRLQAVLGEADIVIGNLEGPIGLCKWPLTSYVEQQFLGHPETPSVLRAAGFNVLNVANNHIMQHGAKCFSDSLRRLEEEQFYVVGCREGERSKPQVIHTREGLRVAILGFSMRPEQYVPLPVPYAQVNSIDEMIDALLDLREVDLTIVSVHWGAEYLTDPAPSQVAAARRILDAGADIILGHHPHVLQRVDMIEGKLVAYSLGNFVSDMWRDLPRRSAVLDVQWTTGKGCSSVTLRPIYIANDGWPDRAPDQLTPEIRNFLPGTDAQEREAEARAEDRYWRRAQRVERLNSLHNRAFFVTHMHRFPARARRQALGHFVFRRLRGLMRKPRPALIV